MKYKKINTKYLTTVFETPEGTGSWFGYYNYDPLNYDQSKLLCQRSSQGACAITKDMSVEIGYYDIPSGKWHSVGVSDSFNWPQGSMLQWIPGTRNKLIYNTSKNNHHIARIVDVDTNETKDIDWAIYGITPDGKKSITIDMDRAHWTRGYHYESVVRPELDVPVLSGDGIFEIDIESNRRRLLIAIEDIIHADYDESFKDAKHWIEHIMISPNGKRFCFLHRFSPITNYMRYTTRLIIANIDGSNLQVIDGWRKYDWSHFGWCDDDSFSIYTYERSKPYDGLQITSANPIANHTKQSSPKSILSCVRTLIPESVKKEMRILIRGQKTYYQYYKCMNGAFSLSDIYKIRDFDIDGHQNYTNNHRYMIADTYPDTHQYQKLIIYNTETKKSLILGRIYAALHQKPGSCDLHPKISRDNSFLMVDSAYNGSHHMILFKINWSEINNVI
ncbi:MAG: hypothetical protein KBT27_06870 [Prevotellaceae bacterium]|nr:hypothetical protein [Candidatus Faecinaster equi]